MEDFLTSCWQIIMAVYDYARVHGWQGGLVASGIGFALVLVGSWFTGEPAYVTGNIVAGVFSGSLIPARRGHARSWFGVLFGILLKLAGIILIFIGIIAGVNGFLYGPLP
ncbi:MAG: hypothetical protein MJE12_01645 [Alphaproteobacteria bacterium]|nr:hypothetical protein [Alphaproteobacteria bacterium]